MTFVKKQALIRAITISIVLILYWLAIYFIDNSLLCSVFCISIVIVSLIRAHINHQIRGDKKKLVSSLVDSYPIGDEREQHLMLSATYMAGQLIVVLVFVLTVILALTNALKSLMLAIPEIMALIIGIIIIYEWLIIGIYWYLDNKY